MPSSLSRRMLPAALALVLTAASSALAPAAVAVAGRAGCVVPERPAKTDTAVPASAADEARALRAITRAKRSTVSRSEAKTPIKVTWHMIKKDDSVLGGDIEDERVQMQIDELNEGFKDSGLSFTLDGIERTTNADWFNNAAPESPQHAAMTKALHKGGAADLNIYSVGSIGMPGYASFPWDYKDEPTKDGVVIDWTTVPHGWYPGHPFGKRAIHEVGHWVGLQDTFHGGCEGGDYVADTAAEAYASAGCPEGRDTCLSDEGWDPIHNYMDDSDDGCVTHFTPGQIRHFLAASEAYRRI
ncbi:zinc metalloprotease [Streptomyces sp. NPDC087440]|uniref:zinc metalloprotease n=1 Tax=Streptomyces sp. NPDC087440 TaxID=3365790 RepID=UPI003812CA4A